MKNVRLSNGVMMPAIGFGVFQIPENETERAVNDAIEIGYRKFDTAAAYFNEEQLGNAIRQSGIKREEFFITTKLWVQDYEYDDALRAFDLSMKKLGLDYLDLYLMHKPYGNYYAAWRALEELYAEGKIRAIGVSNYTADRLVDLVNYNKVVPAVNQVETNLVSQQTEVRTWMDKLGVQHMGYAPFGQGKINEIYADEALQYIAGRYHKTVRQVVLRFQIQSDVVVIPKTTHIERMKENLEVFDFELLDNEMEILRALDKGQPLIGNPQNPDLVSSSIGW